MMRPEQPGRCRFLLLLLLLFCWNAPQAADRVTEADCRPLVLADAANEKPLAHADALLWKISRNGVDAGYIFGTMHVADVRITRLPDVITQALNDSDVFVMEALPEPDEMFLFSQMMYFHDDRTLEDFLGDDLLEHTRSILAPYNLAADSILQLKPWAAFLVMNYPVEEGVPLDLQLLQAAQQNGATLKGLETMSEQGAIFADMPMDMQVQLLLDTVCNYATVEEDFEVMKTLYLQRDLQGLFDYSNRFTVANEPVYTDLLERVLFERNARMVERLLPLLAQKNVFVAIGAMHLPGDKGILSLLVNQGYSITPIY